MIGIGAGDPDHVTVQAVKALNRVDVFFVVDKGGAARELVDLRRDICARYVEGDAHRWVEVRDPERDRRAPGYEDAVEDWRRRRRDLYATLLRDELAGGECGGFLVWGDPSLYDGTIAILDDIRAAGDLELEVEVIPGISSVQALAARHRVPLNRVGGPVLVTTGRRLAGGFPDASDDVVVMLDADCTFTDVADGDTLVYWGAYIGTPDEILVAGAVAEVGDEIRERRREARARKGWIMDTYLLRRPRGDGGARG